MIVINIGKVDFYDVRSKLWFPIGKEIQIDEDVDKSNIDKYLEAKILKIKED